jgi:uncharacterized protein
MQRSLTHTISYIINGLILAIAASTAVGLPAPQKSKSDQHLAEIRKRAEMGYQDQQIELASIYLAGRDVPQDYALAAKWYAKAAGAGNVQAQTQIALFYQYGTGVRADPGRAFHWFQLAAASGAPGAKVNLGVCYLNGVGTPKNTSTAKGLFLEAANKGFGLGALISA